jgi:hypothetical protein
LQINKRLAATWSSKYEGRKILDQDAKVPEIATSVPSNGRRKYHRLPLSLPIRFARENGAIINSSTENLSAEGFYCYALEPLAPGERINGHFVILGEGPMGSNCSVRVNFQAQVMRVDATWMTSRFGIACWIEQYTLGAADSSESWRA